MRQRINIAIAIEVDAEQAANLPMVDGWSMGEEAQVPTNGLVALGNQLADLMATTALRNAPRTVQADVAAMRVNLSKPYEPEAS